MMIDKHNCRCPGCGSEQIYYHVLSSGKYPVPEHVRNVCQKCGGTLRKEDVPEWAEIVREYNGKIGLPGEEWVSLTNSEKLNYLFDSLPLVSQSFPVSQGKFEVWLCAQLGKQWNLFP